MTLSKTSEYALRILVLMANDENKLLSSDSLHKKLKIPKKYLQRLLTILAKEKLIISIRGKYGGYRLGRDSKQINLSRVVEVIEGFNNSPMCFFGFGKCIYNKPCAMHDVWEKTQNDIIKILSSTRLFDLVNT